MAYGNKLIQVRIESASELSPKPPPKRRFMNGVVLERNQ